jgi:hypothetical protein
MTKFRELDSVILCSCGPDSDYGIGHLATIAAISDGIAWVEGIGFPVDTPEPWDIPVDRFDQIRYVLKPDTPDNRRFYGLA